MDQGIESEEQTPAALAAAEEECSEDGTAAAERSCEAQVPWIYSASHHEDRL